MEIKTMVDLFNNIGFPIAIVIILIFVLYKLFLYFQKQMTSITTTYQDSLKSTIKDYQSQLNIKDNQINTIVKDFNQTLNTINAQNILQQTKIDGKLDEISTKIDRLNF